MKKKIDPNAMRISFDLDEVLFVSPVTHKVETELKFPYNKIYKERLRLGTPELIHALQDKGYSVWVYTSSFRSEKYITNLFKHYGVKFTDIVNGERHKREVQSDYNESRPSKLPSKYHISLHIDDENSVRDNGRNQSFNVYQLREQDDEWVEKIIARAEEIRHKQEVQEALRQARKNDQQS